MTLHDSNAAVDRVIDVLESGGASLYFGEAVTQLEHALQTAALADHASASDALVVAALLHDIGHLVHGLDEHIADHGSDAHHEDVGHLWLSDYFGPAVTEPIRLHVAAKRFLCATDAAYTASLSAASLASLALQGGPMSPNEVDAFNDVPWARAATVLRLWDDKAKVPGLTVPPLDHYQSRIHKLMEPR